MGIIFFSFRFQNENIFYEKFVIFYAKNGYI